MFAWEMGGWAGIEGRGGVWVGLGFKFAAGLVYL